MKRRPGRKKDPVLPNPRSKPVADMSVAELVAEARVIIRDLNTVNEQLSAALLGTIRESDDA